MRIIVIDDEEIILEGEAALIRRCIPEAIVTTFRSPKAALEFLRERAADVAFVDLQMEEYHGLDLARDMKVLCPRLNIVFVTAYSEYLESAMQLHVSGYLLKPLKEEQVLEEMRNLRFPAKREEDGLFVRAFGNFEVFYNGRPVMFRYLKTKELFAYLIDRRGALVSRDELITILWGGETNRTSYFKQIQKDLNDTLAKLGKSDLVIKQRGSLGLLAGEINCDYYDWVRGTPEGLNAFMGEYMRQYGWAEETLAHIMRRGEKYTTWL